ncbi:MAG: trehalose-phosphatase, partial [Phycisphaerae bacterium]
MKTRKPDFEWGRFFKEVSGPRPRALLLDYDGTLAPFRIEREQAVPHPELHSALERIVRAGRTRVVVISGRALRDLIPLLGLEPLPELWGCHGWERRLPDGRYRGPELEPIASRALAQARQWARSAGLNGRCEAKPAGIAIHWRGMDAGSIERLRARVRAAWEPFARVPQLELHEFDGGLELRASGRNKEYAVASILRELEDDALVAYAGDDRSDEDAFRALSGRGLRILVRPEYRKTAADL